MKKHTPREISRRKFIASSATAAAGFFIVPRHVLGKGYIAPSDKLNIAFVGVGGRAADHVRATAATENHVAYCDVDERRAKKTYEAQPNVPRYKDFRKMYDEQHKNIDAVMVGTPDHTHAIAALGAMQLNKHVYVEKPLTHNIAETRALLEASRKYKVKTQMGNQGASMECNAELAEMIQSGTIGEIKRVHCWTNRPVWPQGVATPMAPETVPDELDWDLWLGPAPYRPYSEKYMPFKWRGWWDFGTGSFGDMGCHLLQPAYRALKLTSPTSIEATATTVWVGDFVEADYKDSCPPSSVVKMQFPAREGMPACELWWYDGGLRPMRPEELGTDEAFGSWDGGMLFEGSKGKVVAGVFGEKATLLPTMKMKDFAKPKAWLPRYTGEHQMVWVNAIKNNTETSSPFEVACPLTETLLIGNLAVRCYDYKKLKPGKTPTNWEPYTYPGRIRMDWDSAKMRITNFEDANQFVSRNYRDGWAMR